MFFLARFFNEGGFWMYPVLVAGGVAVLCGIVHAAIARGVTLGLALVPLVMILVFGGIGTVKGRRMTQAAMVNAPREMWGALRAEGYKEASRPMELATLLVVASLIPSIAGELRRRRQSSKVT